MLERNIVSAVIISSDQKVLFGKKHPQKGGIYLGKWHIPGGGIESGEDKLTALKREIEEETKVDIRNAKISELDSLGSAETLRRLPSGESVPCRMHFFVYLVELPTKATEVSAEAGDDLVELMWADKATLHEYPLTPPSISLFARLGWISAEQALKQRTFRNADEELVEFTGQPMQWRVSVYALVVKDNKILIIKNKTEKLFDVIGGGVEFGETVEDALYREGLEEGGAHIVVKDLVHTKVDWFYHRGKKQFYQTFQMFYRAELIGELQKPLDEDTELVEFVELATVTKKYQLPVTVQIAIAKL